MIKERFMKLVDAYKSDKEMLEFIQDSMEKFPKYVTAVVAMEYTMPILANTKEGQDYRDAVMRLDQKRRMAHNVVIDACKQLNRCAKSKSIEPIFLGDEDDRHAVADFAGKVVNEFFLDGIHKGKDLKLDNYVKERPHINSHLPLEEVIKQCQGRNMEKLNNEQLDQLR